MLNTVIAVCTVVGESRRIWNSTTCLGNCKFYNFTWLQFQVQGVKQCKMRLMRQTGAWWCRALYAMVKRCLYFRQATKSRWRILNMEKSDPDFCFKKITCQCEIRIQEGQAHKARVAGEETITVSPISDRWLSSSTALKDVEGVELMKFKGTVELRGRWKKAERLRRLAQVRTINHKGNTEESR